MKKAETKTIRDLLTEGAQAMTDSQRAVNPELNDPRNTKGEYAMNEFMTCLVRDLERAQR